MSKLKRELESFQGLWRGGTTLARDGWDSVSRTRNIDGIYEVCIKPYINPDTIALEIGCNGGGWTRKMLDAKRIIGLDALSANHTGFWRNIPYRENIEYHQVVDFECNELDDNSITYVFSYDVFCHISYSGAKSYLKNMYDKLKPNTNCFIMIADPNKYNDTKGMRRLMDRAGFNSVQDFIDDFDGEPHNGRWYFYGTERFCESLEEFGYKLISKDVAVDTDPNSPIIHFIKE